MQVKKLSRNNTNFTGIYNNKTILKGLEKISEHGTSFSAGTAFVLSSTLRPLAILSTPDTEKENKQYACANSICSGAVKFAIVETVALPVEKAVKNIDENPQKFLNTQTIKNFNSTKGKLSGSKSYKLASQIIKLSTGFFTAIPKSMITIALIPILMDKLFDVTANRTEQNSPLSKKKSKLIPFTGQLDTKIAQGLGKIFDNLNFQNFVKKHKNKDSDIAKHMSAATDILLTSSFAFQTSRSNKIKENRKKALIYNNIISTVITLAGGYGLDKIAKNKSAKFIEKFSQINKHDPKLHKYIEGINIVRPALIFAGIYYLILPIISTYIAEKTDKFINKN